MPHTARSTWHPALRAPGTTEQLTELFFDDRTCLSRGARDRAARRGTICPARRSGGPDRHARAHAAAGGRHRGGHRRRILGEPAPRGRVRPENLAGARAAGPADWPLLFERSLPLATAALVKVAPAVERPGIHLGVWRQDGELRVWGTTRDIPVFCLVLEVVAPGLLVIKHHRGEVGKFINVAVLEGDQIKMIDETASSLPDCPSLLASLLGFDTRTWPGGLERARRAGSIDPGARPRRVAAGRAGRGAANGSSRSCIRFRTPCSRRSRRSADLVSRAPSEQDLSEWKDAFREAVEAIAGLTAVDGATIINDRYHLLAFGAKILRRRGSAGGRTGRRHRAHRRRYRRDRAPDAARRHTPSVGGAVRSRPARRAGPRRVAGRPLHGVRLVAVRRHGARSSHRGASSLGGSCRVLGGCSVDLRVLGGSCRVLGGSCRVLGGSCRVLGGSCKVLGESCKVLGGSCRVKPQHPTSSVREHGRRTRSVLERSAKP